MKTVENQLPLFDPAILNEQQIFPSISEVMECPKCFSTNRRVTNTRRSLNSVKRYCECKDCGYRYNSIERFAPVHKTTVTTIVTQKRER
jgi:DNA-directed RNA polymerase subunit M/transcription elongation factor TFIIS